MEQIITRNEEDIEVQAITSEAAVDRFGPQQYYLVQGLLQYQGKSVITYKKSRRFKNLNLCKVTQQSNWRAFRK